MNIKRAALYIRVSTEDQAMHGLSLASEKTALLEYAKEHDMKVVVIFEAEGISARKTYQKCPACCRLLDAISAGNIDVILFIKLDRWFRNIAEYYKVQELLDRHKVDWIATEERYDTTTANGRLSLNIRLSIAQDEADRTSERIKFVFKDKVNRGEVIGYLFPLGYRKGGKPLVIDPEKAEIVRDLFTYYENICSVRGVMYYADERYGLSYPPCGLWLLLSNRTYLGEFRGNPHFCEPIISVEQFTRVQKLLESREIRRSPSGRIYLFSGMMRCPVCGKMMVCQYSNVGKCVYYKCPDAYNRKGYTNRKLIRETYLQKLTTQLEEAGKVIDIRPNYAELKQHITAFLSIYDEMNPEEKKHFYNRVIDHISLDTDLKPAVVFR
ncbi:MAG: recombinase family protein [Clostridiaceae bacterium]|nr:recombinase family protein [Clostridiaceae bacterium]